MFSAIDNFILRDIADFAPYVIAFGFFVVLVFGYMFSNKRASKKRLNARLRSSSSPDFHNQKIARKVLFQDQRSNMMDQRFKKYFKGESPKDALRNKIFRAGLDCSMLQFFLIIFAIWIVIAAAIAFVVKPGILMSIMASFGMCVGGTFIVLNFLEGKQLKAFLALFPLALDIVSRGLKAGSTVEKTFQTVAQEIEDPVGREFQKICEQVNLGLPFEDALREAAVRVSINDFSFFIIALIIQRQTGGSLSSLVVNISGVLRKRQELQLKIKALSAEAKATGIIVGSLPFVVSLAMLYLRPDYFSDFLTDPTGRKLFMIVIGMIFTGAMVIKRMVRFDP